MKIGILGTGDVGKALGNGFITYGHDVTMGSREAGNAKAVAWAAAAGAKAKAGTFAGAVQGADVVVLATLWTGTKSALDMAGGPAAFAGKVLIDATNPLDFSQGAPRLSIGHTDSAGEQVQRWLPEAKVVKAFNMIGNAHMVNPQFPGGPPDLFICGNDDGAKKAVADIGQAFGLAVTDFGGIEMSRVLEPLCILWVAYGIKTGGWNHAFKMLRK